MDIINLTVFSFNLKINLKNMQRINVVKDIEIQFKKKYYVTFETYLLFKKYLRCSSCYVAVANKQISILQVPFLTFIRKVSFSSKLRLF